MRSPVCPIRRSTPILKPIRWPHPPASSRSTVLAWLLTLTRWASLPFRPLRKWQIGDPEQGAGTQTEEFPLLLWTPHSLRRAHTVNDNVVSLREAFPQECFMSVVDAEARGIETGDLVLMTSPHGKVLRPAKVLPTIVPGAVALQDGAWLRIDEETGHRLGRRPQRPSGAQVLRRRRPSRGPARSCRWRSTTARWTLDARQGRVPSSCPWASRNRKGVTHHGSVRILTSTPMQLLPAARPARSLARRPIQLAGEQPLAPGVQLPGRHLEADRGKATYVPEGVFGYFVSHGLQPLRRTRPAWPTARTGRHARRTRPPASCGHDHDACIGCKTCETACPLRRPHLRGRRGLHAQVRYVQGRDCSR